MKPWIVLYLAFAAPAFSQDLCVNLAQFTAEQIQVGEQYFNSSCGLCHQYNLQGRVPGNAANESPNNFGEFPAFYLKFMDGSGGVVPPLIGPKYMARFKTFPEFVLFAPSAANTPEFYPPLAPKKGADWVDTYVKLAAYILSRNCAAPTGTR